MVNAIVLGWFGSKVLFNADQFMTALLVVNLVMVPLLIEIGIDYKRRRCKQPI